MGLLFHILDEDAINLLSDSEETQYKMRDREA